MPCQLVWLTVCNTSDAPTAWPVSIVTTSAQPRFHASTQIKSSVLMVHVRTQVLIASSHQTYESLAAAVPLQSDVQMAHVITTAPRCRSVVCKMVKLLVKMAAVLWTMTCAQTRPIARWAPTTRTLQALSNVDMVPKSVPGILRDVKHLPAQQELNFVLMVVANLNV